MDVKTFSLNINAQYTPGVVGKSKEGIGDTVTKPSILVQNDGGAFQTQYPNVFAKYRLPGVNSDELIQAWNSNQMQFWQNQVNFAVWCATTGCGVSAQDHILASAEYFKSLYRFHVYYQVRRILEELQAPQPQDLSWDAFDNPYDQLAYERICGEFGVSENTSWHVKTQNNGLGRVYFLWGNKEYIQNPQKDGIYDPSYMSFTKETYSAGDEKTIVHIEHILQDDPDADTAWTTFILDKSEGFTRAGVERVNDSIRTYVWAILGSQAQTRTGILGTGTAFDAQKQFLANIEDAVLSPVDLPSAIVRYQDVLRYARSKVDFAFGVGLYMAPSNMELQIGTIQDYNNEIVIAGLGQKLGINDGINTSPSLPPVRDMEGSAARPAQPVEVKPMQLLAPSHDLPDVVPIELQEEGQAHYDGLTALVVGGVALGLAWLAVRSVRR